MDSLKLPQIAEEFNILDWFNKLREVEDNNGNIDISFSFWSWSLFRECPLKFRRLVLLKERPPEDKRKALAGIVLHEIFNQFFGAKTKDFEWIENNFHIIFDICCTKNNIEWETEQEQQAVYQRTKLYVDYTRGYFKGKPNLFTDYEIKNEYQFKIKVLPNLFLTGRIDLWLIDTNTKLNYLFDYKASAEVPNSSDQLKIYTLASLSETNNPAELSLFLMAHMRKIVRYQFNNSQYLYLLQRIHHSAELLRNRLKTNSFEPTPSVKSCQWCHFTNSCDVCYSKYKNVVSVNKLQVNGNKNQKYLF